MPYDIDLRRVRVTFTYLRRDGTTGRASTETWADSLRDARRVAGPDRLSVRARWIGGE